MLVDILEEHFDEASFMAEQWVRGDGQQNRRAVRRRLLAHLEGLLQDRTQALALCEDASGASVTFIAAWLANQGNPPQQTHLGGRPTSPEEEAGMRRLVLLLEED